MNAGTFGLQIDLKTGRVSHQFGFDQAPVEEGNRSVSARHRWASDTRTLFAAGRFFSVDDSAALGERLRELAASDWEPSRCGIDGDFVIIAIDEPGRRVVLWSDRNGASRCYYAVRGQTVFLSNSRLEIARTLGDARLSPTAVYEVLALGYVIDPESLIEGVSVTQSGQRITIDASGTQVVRYEEPVRIDAEYYSDGATAVRELDDSLRAVFQKRVSGRNPCILLSGGIDSVAMLRYARDAYSGTITTLTFSVRNLPRNELEPAGIAARYFQTDHHELVVDPAHAATHFSRMLLESDSFDYASLFGMAEREALLADGRSFDVFSGQDNRLHTPTFDLPRELAATVIRKVGVAVPRGWHFAARVRCFARFRHLRALKGTCAIGPNISNPSRTFSSTFSMR